MPIFFHKNSFASIATPGGVAANMPEKPLSSSVAAPTTVAKIETEIAAAPAAEAIEPLATAITHTISVESH